MRENPDVVDEIMARERSWVVRAEGIPPVADATTRAPEPKEECMIANVEDDGRSDKAKKQAAYWAKMTPEERHAEHMRRMALGRARRAGGAVAAPVTPNSKKTAAPVSEAVTLPQVRITIPILSELEVLAGAIRTDLAAIERTISLMRLRMGIKA